jgi:hypothetical protein
MVYVVVPGLLAAILTIGYVVWCVVYRFAARLPRNAAPGNCPCLCECGVFFGAFLLAVLWLVLFPGHVVVETFEIALGRAFTGFLWENVRRNSAKGRPRGGLIPQAQRAQCRGNRLAALHRGAARSAEDSTRACNRFETIRSIALRHTRSYKIQLQWKLATGGLYGAI